MTAVDDILSRIPLSDLAARLGVDEGTAEQATRQALPALLGGIQANAADPRGAASFAEAVQQHDNDLVEGGVNLDGVDEKDGERIVGHVFGDQRAQVVQQLGTTGGASTNQQLMRTLLPILAPIVMSYLARRLGGGGAAAGQQGGLGGVLGGVLGGQAGQEGGLGDVLGSILGGMGGQQGGQAGPQQAGPQQGDPQQGGLGGVLGGPLGDLLGGLLGGGRRA